MTRIEYNVSKVCNRSELLNDENEQHNYSDNIKPQQKNPLNLVLLVNKFGPQVPDSQGCTCTPHQTQGSSSTEWERCAGGEELMVVAPYVPLRWPLLYRKLCILRWTWELLTCTLQPELK